MVEAISWRGHALILLDQRVLPFETRFMSCETPEQTAEAIRAMVVRGAPAIGVSAAYGLVLGLRRDPSGPAFERDCETLAASRPTAVNLFDAIAYMRNGLGEPATWKAGDAIADRAESLARAYHAEDLRMNHEIGRCGASFLPGVRHVLTHCNTGSLATSGWGTALGIVRQLHAEKRLARVYADETRPFLQGARLTVWECLQDELPVTLCTDGMGGYLMSKGLVDCVIVGSDRITARGDVANKIGTFMLAMAARYHGIPFVVAAPSTTIDRNLEKGADIPIEQRDPREVLTIRGSEIAPAEVPVINPAFDVTPHELVSAIVTEKGVFQAPYDFRTAG